MESLPIDLRDATHEDAEDIVGAIVVLQDHERALHDSRRPGNEIARPYYAEIEARSRLEGAMIVATIDGVFVGFVAGWVETEDALAETADSRRFGYISDICVLPAWRGRRIAAALLQAMEARLAAQGLTRIRINVLAANASARASYERAGFRPYALTRCCTRSAWAKALP